MRGGWVLKLKENLKMTSWPLTWSRCMDTEKKPVWRIRLSILLVILQSDDEMLGALHITKCSSDFHATSLLPPHHEPHPEENTTQKNSKGSPVLSGNTQSWKTSKWNEVSRLVIPPWRKWKHNLGKGSFRFIIISSSVIKGNHLNTNFFFK